MKCCCSCRNKIKNATSTLYEVNEELESILDILKSVERSFSIDQIQKRVTRLKKTVNDRKEKLSVLDVNPKTTIEVKVDKEREVKTECFESIPAEEHPRIFVPTDDEVKPVLSDIPSTSQNNVQQMSLDDALQEEEVDFDRNTTKDEYFPGLDLNHIEISNPIAELLVLYPKIVFKWSEFMKDNKYLFFKPINLEQFRTWDSETTEVVNSLERCHILIRLTDRGECLNNTTLFLKETRRDYFDAISCLKIDALEYMREIMVKAKLSVASQLMKYDRTHEFTLNKDYHDSILNSVCLGILQMSGNDLHSGRFKIANKSMLEEALRRLTRGGFLIRESGAPNMPVVYHKAESRNLNVALQVYGFTVEFYQEVRSLGNNKLNFEDTRRAVKRPKTKREDHALPKACRPP